MKRRNVCMVTLAALMVAVSCSVVDFFEKRSEPVDVAGDLPHGMIVLGEQSGDAEAYISGACYCYVHIDNGFVLLGDQQVRVC